MLKYNPTEHQNLFDAFTITLKGNEYEISSFSFGMYNAIRQVAEEAMTEKAANELVIALIGKEEFDKIKPLNPIEVQMLAMWLIKEFFAPLAQEDKDSKNETGD